MREFAALFAKAPPQVEESAVPDVGTWSVIAKDPEDKFWFVEVQDVGSEELANRLADALNLQARSDYENVQKP